MFFFGRAVVGEFDCGVFRDLFIVGRVNAAWKRLFGISQEIMPHSLEKYSILEDEEATTRGIMPLLERAFKGEAVALPPVKYDTEYTLKTFGLSGTAAKTPWLQSRYYPLTSAAGEILNVVGIHEDITEQVEARNKLIESEEKFSKFFYEKKKYKPDRK